MPTSPISEGTPEWVKGDLPPEQQASPAETTPAGTPASAVPLAANDGAPVLERPENSEHSVESNNAAAGNATAGNATAGNATAGEATAADVAAGDPAAKEAMTADMPFATTAEQKGADHASENSQSGVGERVQGGPEPTLGGHIDSTAQTTQAIHQPAEGSLSSAELASTTGPAVVPEPTSEPRQSIEVLSASPLGIEAQVESLLFVADGAVPIGRLAEALEVSNREIEAALAGLTEAYRQRGLSLQRFRDKVQLTTAPAAASWVERFLGLAAATPLSRAALETLAIVAYQQPVTRPQIEAVRGVNSDSVIKNLLGKGLIEELGRAEGPGRPVLYSTTPEFMQHFGLATLSDLPPLSLSSPESGLHPEQILKG